jgi:hypothetical protein
MPHKVRPMNHSDFPPRAPDFGHPVPPYRGEGIPRSSVNARSQSLRRQKVRIEILRHDTAVIDARELRRRHRHGREHRAARPTKQEVIA